MADAHLVSAYAFFGLVLATYLVRLRLARRAAERSLERLGPETPHSR